MSKQPWVVEDGKKYLREIGRQFARKYRAKLEDADAILPFKVSQRGLCVNLKDRIAQDVQKMRSATLARMIEAAPTSTFDFYSHDRFVNGRTLLKNMAICVITVAVHDYLLQKESAQNKAS